MNAEIITKPIIPQELAAFMDTYPQYIIAGHQEPDGDCIGSCLALSAFLQRQGKKTILISQGPFKRPEIMRYKKEFLTEVPKNIDADTTGLCLVDCAELRRVGSIADGLNDFPVAVIDHHVTSKPLGTASLIMPEAPSATYLIQSLIEAVKGSVTAREAEFLFLGLCTDTDFFRHLDMRSQHVFEHVSRLVSAGANPSAVFTQMNGGRSLNSRLLLARMLTRMQRYYDDRLLISYETLEDAEEFGPNTRDSDLTYRIIQSIRGVEAVILIRQEDSEMCSVGFRSKDRIDVSKIAGQFGGGGHKNASGAYVQSTIEQLIPQFVQACKNQMEQQK